jgi:hypothetical protein
MLSKRGRRAVGSGGGIIEIVLLLVLLTVILTVIHIVNHVNVVDVTTLILRTTCGPISSLYNLVKNLLGFFNVKRTVWVTSDHFFASKLLKLAL